MFDQEEGPVTEAEAGPSHGMSNHFARAGHRIKLAFIPCHSNKVCRLCGFRVHFRMAHENQGFPKGINFTGQLSLEPKFLKTRISVGKLN